MHNFQSYIKSVREAKNLEQKTIADAINLSEDTIYNIEEADSNSLLQTSSTLLKNQIRRYCEYLEIQERKIISILNKIDILHYKKSRYGKLKPFDYLNRILILVVIIAIATLGFQVVQKQMSLATNNPNPQSSKSSIIYTPINYEMDNTGDEVVAEEAQNTTVDSNSTTDSNVAEASIPNPVLTDTEEAPRKKLAAHPPATANMNNMVIDEPSDK